MYLPRDHVLHIHDPRARVTRASAHAKCWLFEAISAAYNTTAAVAAAVGLRRMRRRVPARLKRSRSRRPLTMRPELIHLVVLAWAPALVGASASTTV